VALPRPLRLTLLTGALALTSLTLAHPCRAADDSSDDASNGDKAEGDGEKSGSDKAKPETGDKAKAGEEKADKDTSFGHMGQVGLRAGLVGGFRMILRYGSSPYCRLPDPLKPPDKQVKFCGHTAPFDADFGLSFGVLDFFEPFAWARLGLSAEGETDTKPLVVIGAGARIYTMSDNAFKIFIEPAVGWELEGGRGNPAWQLNGGQYKKDFLFHIAAGPQLDFSRNVGAYLTGGLTAGFVRDLGASFDVNLGVQGRYP
jgi:hypothetical protein